MEADWVDVAGNLADGNSDILYFHPENWGRKSPNLTIIFFRWVGSPTTNQLVYQRATGHQMVPSFFRDFSPAVGWSHRMSSCAEWLYRIALLGVSLIVLILMGSMSCKKGWVYRFLLEQMMKTTIFLLPVFLGAKFSAAWQAFSSERGPGLFAIFGDKMNGPRSRTWCVLHSWYTCCWYMFNIKQKTNPESLCPFAIFWLFFLGEGGGGANTKSQVFDVEIWHYGVIHGLDRIPGWVILVVFFFHGIPRRNLG